MREWYMYLFEGRVTIALEQDAKGSPVRFACAFRHRGDSNRNDKTKAKLIARGRLKKDPWVVTPTGAYLRHEIAKVILKGYTDQVAVTGIRDLMVYAQIKKMPTWFLKRLRQFPVSV